MSPVPVSRLRAADLLHVGTIGLRTRRVRAVLSMLGVTIGIAALVAVLGVTCSSQGDLLARIDALGTNLLTVTTGNINDTETPLPTTAVATIPRTDGVLAATATSELAGRHVYRSDRVETFRHAGTTVRATDPTLLSTLDGRLLHGTFISEATGRYPPTVRWYTVIGILAPFELAPEIDHSALVGYPIAAADFGYDGHPTRIYVRAETERTRATAGLLPRAANPRNPSQVHVDRPSDALATRLAVADSGTALFLGLGAVALLVGGIGIANVMVISVLERRAEIGLRRALGAARRHVAGQFLIESLLLAAAGGATGVAAGGAVTYLLAHQRGWQPLIPAAAVYAGLAAAIVIGALAGLYPAMRAARMPPTEALRTA